MPYIVKNELGGGAGQLGLVFAAGGLGAVRRRHPDGTARPAAATHGRPLRELDARHSGGRGLRLCDGAVARHGRGAGRGRARRGRDDRLDDAHPPARADRASRPDRERRLARLGRPRARVVRAHGTRSPPCSAPGRRSSPQACSVPSLRSPSSSFPGCVRPSGMGRCTRSSGATISLARRRRRHETARLAGWGRGRIYPALHNRLMLSISRVVTYRDGEASRLRRARRRQRCLRAGRGALRRNGPARASGS